MKIIRARFINFRLLRDLHLEFSTDKTKKLTVIRAENETGKTTILTALQWALYGDNALPGNASEYRLHPIDWDITHGSKVAISASVEFETTYVRNSDKGVIETTHKYRIIRSAFETIKGAKWERLPSTVRLFDLADAGSDPIKSPEAEINEELPPELRDVFFTDGDRALSFIEATSAKIKRGRVQKAIRSLLGLDVIEDSKKHVEKSASEFNKQAKNTGSGTKAADIANRIQEIDKAKEGIEAELQDALSQFTAFDEKLEDIQKSIDAALVKGDRDKLKHEIKQTEARIDTIEAQRTSSSKNHAALFKGMELARDILGPVLEMSLDKLSKLRDEGKIPHTTIPVLEECLNKTSCICGESLDSKSSDGKDRRKHIQELIEETKASDDLQSSITDLYFGSRSLLPNQINDDDRWTAKYAAVSRVRDDLERLRKEQGKILKSLEAQVDAIPDVNIRGLRDTKRQYMDQRDRFNSDSARLSTEREALVEERIELVIERDKSLREQKKGSRILAELEVTQDIVKVFNNAYDKITREELSKVSEHMNKIFLEMIGADPKQGAIINRAEINNEFDIVVFGPKDKLLNPDRDLNGASRRALTLAFILALTKVSEVEAPNVIDTPLGMMSGFVKKSVLQTAVRESSQLVLFLTRSEIASCEKIISAKAGSIITLTNPAHYPLMLSHNPNIDERRILRCDCNHLNECKQCARTTDFQQDAEAAE